MQDNDFSLALNSISVLCVQAKAVGKLRFVYLRNGHRMCVGLARSII